MHHLQLARATIRESTGCTPFQPLESENAEQQRNVMSKTMKTAPSEPTEGHSEVTGRGFEGWSPELIEESKKSDTNGRVGTRLLWESSVARIWVIELRPGGRLPFHRHVLNYFWTVLTPGIAHSHTADGLTRHVPCRAGGILSAAGRFGTNGCRASMKRRARARSSSCVGPEPPC